MHHCYEHETIYLTYYPLLDIVEQKKIANANEKTMKTGIFSMRVLISIELDKKRDQTEAK